MMATIEVAAENAAIGWPAGDGGDIARTEAWPGRRGLAEAARGGGGVAQETRGDDGDGGQSAGGAVVEASSARRRGGGGRGRGDERRLPLCVEVQSRCRCDTTRLVGVEAVASAAGGEADRGGAWRGRPMAACRDWPAGGRRCSGAHVPAEV